MLQPLWETTPVQRTDVTVASIVRRSCHLRRDHVQQAYPHHHEPQVMSLGIVLMRKVPEEKLATVRVGRCNPHKPQAVRRNRVRL
jgi:hypothetical protein